MSETRTDADFISMLEERKRSYSSALSISTKLIVLVAIILIGMFIFLV